MSLAGWRKRLDEKITVAEETNAVREKLQMHKINKEFNSLTGEELFKPITERMDKAAVAAAEPDEEEEAPDYDMEEFDQMNPFNADEFNSLEETPPRTPPLPAPDDDEFLPPLPPLEEMPPPPKGEGMDETVVTEFALKSNESVDLRTLNMLITNYRVKKDSKFYGMNLEELVAMRDEIYARQQGASWRQQGRS